MSVDTKFSLNAIGIIHSILLLDGMLCANFTINMSESIIKKT